MRTGFFAAVLYFLSEPERRHDLHSARTWFEGTWPEILAELLFAFVAIFIYRTLELLKRERQQISAWWNRVKSGRKLILLWLDADVATARHLVNQLRNNLPHVRIRALDAPSEIMLYPLRKSVVEAVILISTDVTKLSSEDTLRDDIERRVDRYVLDGGGLVAGHDIIYHRTRNTLLTKAFGATIERFDDKEVDNKKIPIKYEKTSAATKDPIWRRLPDHFNLDDDELLVTSWTKGASILFTEEGVPERALVVARTHDKGRLVWLNSCDRGKSGLAKSIGDPSREFVNLLTASVQWVAKRRPPPIGAPLIGAHRGVAGSGGENTLAAFGEAIRQRADFIETDIRKTKDGILVLHHDEKIGFAYIAETSFSDLQSIASVRKRPLAKLEELLALAKDRIMLDLELKESGYEGEIVALLQKHQVDTDDFVVTSFLEEAIRQFKNAYKEATCGLLVGKRSWWREWFLLRRVERSGADFVAANDRLVRLWFARRMARHDHPVWVWTVNDPARIARLLRTTGVEAVITDIVTTAKTEQETARSS